MDFIIDLPPFHSFNSILVVVDRLTKMAHFIPWNKIIIGKNIAKLFFIMFFDIMAFLKILFLIMDPSLHPSFGSDSLND
jgi:hypothetical protein